MNLTAADTAIRYDPWRDLTIEEQSTDRADRIGQDESVPAYRLVAAGTFEENARILKERQKTLAAEILGASTRKALALTEDNIDMLFASVDG